MKRWLFLAALLASPLEARSAGEEARPGRWTEVVESDGGRYSLAFDPDKKSVDVTRLDPSTAAPAAVKVRIHRRNASPLDLKLKAIEPPRDPIHYEGHFRQWEGSVIGFELEMSFDQKAWRKVKRFFGAKGTN